MVGDGACARVENHVHGLAGDHVERLADGGERRVQVLCRVHVVEADDRQVSGQGQAALAGSAVHVERRDVVACEDRSRPFGGGQVGILESLSGMRVNVRFISFDDVLEHGVADDIDVIVTGGPVDTAFSGGSVWAEEPRLAATLRAWVHGGGALIGVGQPSAQQFQGRFFQLADVLGVDEERHQTLSVDKYFPAVTPEHFITADVHLGEGVLQGFLDAGYRKPLSGCGGGQAIGELGGIDFGEPIADTFPVNEDVTLLRADGGQVQLAVNEYGKGRGVYVSGLPYSAANARLLERALFWASHNEGKYAAYSSSNPECEVAVFDKSGCYCVVNNTDRAQSTYVERGDGRIERIELAPSGIAWRTI